MKKRIALLIVLIAAGVGTWLYIGDGSESQTRYRTAKVTRGSISDIVTANGALNPMEQVTVGSQVSGQVSVIHVKVNDEVKKGQLLAEIDPALSQAALRQSKANLETARSAFEQATRDLDRTRMLVQKDFLPKVDLERAQQTHLSAKNSYESAKTQVERDEVNLGYTKIISPIDGVVISQEATTGQTLAASTTVPNLFKIAGDLKQMKIDVSFAESDISKVKVDMPVKFTVDAFPDREFEGKVAVVNLNPTNTQGVVTYSVTVSVDNKDRLLLPGMTAYVSVTLSEEQDVLRVPAASLRFTPPVESSGGLKTLFQPGLRGGRFPRPVAAPPGKGTVYLLKGGSPQAVEVTLGKSDDSNVAISGEGVTEGDEVIIGILPSARS